MLCFALDNWFVGFCLFRMACFHLLSSSTQICFFWIGTKKSKWKYLYAFVSDQSLTAISTNDLMVKLEILYFIIRCLLLGDTGLWKICYKKWIKNPWSGHESLMQISCVSQSVWLHWSGSLLTTLNVVVGDYTNYNWCSGKDNFILLGVGLCPI